MANCHDLFSSFHESIKLSSSGKENLRKARDAVRECIKNAFRDAKRIPVPTFCGQGSYAMSTIVNPLSGEYDIDDGVYLQNLDKNDNSDWPTPEAVHKWIVDAVRNHTKVPPIDKRTCVRVVYAGKYHLDLPIYAELNGNNLHAEKGEKGWHSSDPKAITDWFLNAASTNGEQLRRMVRYFKAWSDHAARNGKLPSGLVYTVLVVENFSYNDRDDVCFGGLARAIHTRMLGSLRISNPVDEAEDLLGHLSTEQKSHFLGELDRLKSAAAKALSEEDKIKSCKAWKKEFGDRWVDCSTLEGKTAAKYTVAPAILRDDARSA